MLDSFLLGVLIPQHTGRMLITLILPRPQGSNRWCIHCSAGCHRILLVQVFMVVPGLDPGKYTRVVQFLLRGCGRNCLRWLLQHLLPWVVYVYCQCF